MSPIHTLQSRAQDARTAVRELHQGVMQPDTELVIFFCSSRYDLTALADEVNRLFGDMAVVGCTTAGGIGPLGDCDHTLAGVGFPAGSCTAVTGRLDALQHFSDERGQAFTEALLQCLDARAMRPGGGNRFGFLLIDAFSVDEEQVARTLQTALGDIMLVGGSAGDDPGFSQPRIFHDGAFRRDSAVLILLSTDFPFRLFNTQHLLSQEERLVDTRANAEQRALIRRLEEAHHQLLQSEKLASIGQLAAGIAHEINNPIGFVNSNLGTLRRYLDDLLRLVGAYETVEPSLPAESAGQIAALKAELELDYLREDVGSLIAESIEGTARVRRIVQDLRDFSRTGATDWQFADLHQGLESTLNVAANEIKYKATVVREYGQLPAVECVPAQLNQVFLNLLINAAQAIEERGNITVRTGCEGDQVWLAFADDGEGIPAELQSRIFDPFFTTKPVGQGTGLGLSLSYGIVQKHGGRFDIDSRPGEGTTFTLWLPIRRASGRSASAVDQP